MREGREYPSLFSPAGWFGPLSAVQAGLVISLLALATARVDASAGEGSRSEKSKRNSRQVEKDEGPAVSEELDSDQEFVRQHLEDYLHPTSLQFLEDGRVRLSFDFEMKNPDHERIFSPPIQKRSRSNWRWTTAGEEYYGRYSSYRGSGFKGLRLGNYGMALLNCWFEDEVEAEIEYTHGTNFVRRQIVALAFYTDKHRALGGNLGSQAVLFTKRRAGKRVGEAQPLVIDKKQKLKIGVNRGRFEVHRNGRRNASIPYPEKRYGSGRIGFIWSGGIAGAVSKMVIVGRIDAKNMADRLRKVRR